MIAREDVLVVEDLRVSYRVQAPFGRRRDVVAVDGVSFSIPRGETLGLVGESGSGKTTIARAVLRLIRPDDGRIEFLSKDITGMSQGDLRPLRRELQMITQNPYASLNPRRRVGDIVADPLVVHGLASKSSAREQAVELLEMVGLDAHSADSFPHQFSGGQRQRIAIARAIALRPSLIVCDEIVSGQDISIQARLINLLKSLQSEFHIALLFISHDLRVVRNIAHNVAVLKDGNLVEYAPSDELFTNPTHPYTAELLASVALRPLRRERRRVEA